MTGNPARSLRVALRRRLAAAGPDGGFTLIEATVATVIVGIMLVGLTVTVVNGWTSVRNTRAHQQASILALEGVEFARALAWDELATVPPVPVVDPRVKIGPPKELDGVLLDLPADEAVVDETSVPGALLPYKTTETWDNVTFDVYHYVTDVAPDLRRVVVYVEWTINGTHDEWTTALVSRLSAP